MVRRCRCFLLCLAAALAVRAGDIEVTAGVNATRIGLDDTLLLTLTFRGVSILESPELAQLGDFRVLQVAQQFESHTVNQRTTSAIHFSYTLAPRRTGTLLIPAFAFELQGKTLRTTPFQIQVVNGSVNPPSPPPSSPFDLDSALPSTRGTSSERIQVMLRTKLSKHDLDSLR